MLKGVKILLFIFIMTDIFDIIHYLIGFIILSFLIWLLIQTHNYFSKNNIPIKTETFKNKKT
jgi:hypothetical protein